MASIKDLKKRIGSVKNTQQTTRAMKMVSAAKLRRAQEAVVAQRPYAKKIGELIQLMASMPGSEVDSPVLRREIPESGKKLLLLVVTSDRGLCAGFNSNIIKTVQRLLTDKQGEYASITLSFVGKRGFDYFKTRKVNLGKNYSEFAGKVTYQKASKLAQAVIAQFLEGEVDEVHLVYNEFKNAITQTPVVEQFLPLKGMESAGASAEVAMESPMVLVKPNSKFVLENLLLKHFPTQIFRVLLDSQAGEHGARMSAMENATKNAGEMIKKLTLQYNKQRQAGITKELLEIISGSEAQKS